MSALREWMAERDMRSSVKVGYLGKLKTATQMVSIVTLLFTTVGSTAKTSDGLILISQENKLCTLDTLNSCSLLFTSGAMLFMTSVILSILSAGQYLVAAWPALTSFENRKH